MPFPPPLTLQIEEMQSMAFDILPSRVNARWGVGAAEISRLPYRIPATGRAFLEDELLEGATCA